MHIQKEGWVNVPVLPDHGVRALSLSVVARHAQQAPDDQGAVIMILDKPLVSTADGTPTRLPEQQRIVGILCRTCTVSEIECLHRQLPGPAGRSLQGQEPVLPSPLGMWRHY